ncbi:hypothetical protein E1265_17480 [Streptomyces sp. 8K308]|uniref:hypothetical protein n=1 Tax=Streptomyces sp. 8K308 TaxID=2530388 RepID=UPI00104BC7F2|nr:hypothetical protein [Streptomyces sp. 8K308]TDC21627.1 hypothetical protein E1265_17480 [Streptomyces sp. 8K308]
MWAAATSQLGADLEAAAALATDPAVRSAIQAEASATAEMAAAIPRDEPLDGYLDAWYEAAGMVRDACYPAPE